MYDRFIKSGRFPGFHAWAEEEGMRVSSTRNRGLYAEYVFRKFCQEEEMLALSLTPLLPAIEQIPLQHTKKTQQKELRKLGKLPFRWLVLDRKSSVFVSLKMGTSPLSGSERLGAAALQKTRCFLFRAFEDGEALIKEIR